MTINNIRALAEQLEADAKVVRTILAAAESGDISLDRAAKLLRMLRIAA